MKKLIVGVIFLVIVGSSYWVYSRFVNPKVDYVKTALAVLDLYGSYQDNKSIDYAQEVKKLLVGQYHMKYTTDDSIAAYRNRLSEIDKISFDFEMANPGMFKNPITFDHVFKASLNDGLKLDIITHNWGIAFVIYCETPDQKVIAKKMREELINEARKVSYFDPLAEYLMANFYKKIRLYEGLNTVSLTIR